ncbi:MAG: nitroreductase family protein [Sphingomonadaceae bacterium]|nr:nitroreductase family protein [Sphingomonadaceae bacterium]
MKLERKLLAVEETGTAYKRRGVRRVLYAVLPENFYDRLRGWRLQFDASPLGQSFRLAGARYLSVISKSGVLSALHYAFFSREFDREHQAVLAARARHIRDVFAGRGNLYMLRRNVHRLEKGLIMKPPRPIFGLDKIGETVTAHAACLRQLRNGEEHMRTSIEWSTEILNAYFARVSDHPVVREAKARFDAAEAENGVPVTEERVPFVREQPASLPTIEQLEQLALYRRSARWFDQRPVPREVIDRAVLIAAQSPTACNRQPFRFEFFDRHDLVQKVGAVPKGTPGWLHQIPCFMVIIGKFEAFRFERDRHVPYIDGCLAAMALINALEVQGVSSCCVNFPDFADTEKRMAEALDLPPWERAIMCLAIGYPEDGEPVPFSQKLPLDMIRRFNNEG